VTYEGKQQGCWATTSHFQQVESQATQHLDRDIALYIYPLNLSGSSSSSSYAPSYSRSDPSTSIPTQLTRNQTERATALGFFLSGTLVGPALGPFIGGIIVTFRSWRDIFWLQTALAATATILCFFLQPETIHVKRATELEGLPPAKRAKKMWQWLNPFRIIVLYRYPNLLLTVRIRSFYMYEEEANLWKRHSRPRRWCGTCTPFSRRFDMC
jgi:MFS family permease